MKQSQRRFRRTKIFLPAVLFAAAVAAASHFNLFYRLDNSFCDLIYQRERSLDGNIFVLGIDEKALEQFGPIQTWERGVMADVIDTLNQNPDMRPSAIGLDMMYYGETDPQEDAKLAEAAGRYGNVVTGSSVNFKTELIADDDGHYIVNPLAVESLGQPYLALREATLQGHLNTLPDEDGYVRASLHQIVLPDASVLPSFASQLYRLYASRHALAPEPDPPQDARGLWYIPYSAKPGGYNDSFSVVDLLSGELPSELFDGAVVLIGPYASGMRDAYLTPIDHARPMNGVEIHANILQAMIDGNRYVQQIPSIWQSAFFLVILFGLYFPLCRFGPKVTTPLVVFAVAGYIWGAWRLSLIGWTVKVLYLPLGALLLYLFWLGAGYLREFIDRKRMTDTFKRYVAPQVVDEIIRGGAELRLGGEKREIACLFVDIRGFTPLSESLEPEQVVEVLNEALALTSQAVFAHNGTLDKFIGDATMAIYNAPLAQEDYIYRAVQTAWHILQGGGELSRRLEERGMQGVRFGIGVNAGPAVIGNIGTNIRMDYTAIGDTVNTTSRLESMAQGGQVLISESVYLAVKDRIEAASLGEISLDGKAKSITVYELIRLIEEK